MSDYTDMEFARWMWDRLDLTIDPVESTINVRFIARTIADVRRETLKSACAALCEGCRLQVPLIGDGTSQVHCAPYSKICSAHAIRALNNTGE